jgi:hypothetical protein
VSSDPIADHFAHWLKFGSGCSFAARFAQGKEQRISFATNVGSVDAAALEYLNEHFRGAANTEQTAVAIFPALQTEGEVIHLLQVLTSNVRWRVRRVESPSFGAALVGLEWQTDFGPWAQAMGFAPLLTMPTTRRAPYVAIAAWPGRARRRKVESPNVGFGDMPSHLAADVHQRLLNKSAERTAQLFGSTFGGPNWREIAFSFDPTQRDRLAWL